MCFLFAGGNEQSCLGLVFPGVSEWKGRSSVRRELRTRGRLPLLPGRPRGTVPFQTQIQILAQTQIQILVQTQILTQTQTLIQTQIQIQNPRASVGTSLPRTVSALFTSLVGRPMLVASWPPPQVLSNTPPPTIPRCGSLSNLPLCRQRLENSSCRYLLNQRHSFHGRHGLVAIGHGVPPTDSFFFFFK